MEELKKLINSKFEAIKQYFVSDSNFKNSKNIEKKQRLNQLLVLIFVIACFVLVMFLLRGSNSKVTDDKMADEITEEYKTIELGSSSTSGESKWQGFLEEEIEREGQKRAEQIDLLKQAVEDSKNESKEEVNSEFSEIKARLSFALNEIERLKTANHNMQNDINSLGGEEGGRVVPAEIGLTSIIEAKNVMVPVSSYNYIPSTSYVSGYLLGGISVSTSVNSASEPIPVVIKLTDRGNLPKDFAVDIKQCRILASCYGDISSERAIIRAEELVCEDKENSMLLVTKVAGVINGDDGANGIRGSVVSMSDKHLKNAFIGGILSGFSNTARGQSGLNITSFGAISTKQQGIKDMAQDGLTGGVATAAEKLADYNIKLAENISPVILVPGGTKVDVVFTKSVQIGSLDVEEVINAERDRK